MTESKWGRLRRSKRAEDEFRPDDEHADDEGQAFADRGTPREPAPRPVPARGPADPAALRPASSSGVESLFADEDEDEALPPPPVQRPEPPDQREQPTPRQSGPPVPAERRESRPPAPGLEERDPIRDALRERERASGEAARPRTPAEAARPRTPAEAARDELAALLASTEAQTALDPALAASRDPLVGTAEPREGSALEALTRAGEEGESWDAIQSMFRRGAGQAGSEESDEALQLDWERPEMFSEPTQEEILRRIGDLTHGLEMVQQAVEDLARPLSEMTEPGTRLAAAFKRLELIERSFEEMRLQSERNTLKTSSALSSMDTSLGELRAAMEEPMWEMSERLTSAEIRLTELQANERLVDQLNQALAKDPFDLVSTRDIDEITDSITTKVKRLGGRVERLEAALDRSLSGLEEARRAALGAAKEMNRVVEKANRVLQAPSGRSRSSGSGAEPASRATTAAKRTPAKKAAAAKATTKKAAAKKPAAKRTPRATRS